MRGGTTVTPSASRRSRFSATARWRYMVSCMAGTTTTGMPLPSAVVAKVVTGVSSMPHAILPTVFAVQGATRRRSALPVLAAPEHVLDEPGDRRDRGPAGRVREGVGADDPRGRAREDGLDRGPAPPELVGEPDRLDGRDRARDGEHDLLSFECLDCHRITRSWTVWTRPGPYVLTGRHEDATSRPLSAAVSTSAGADSPAVAFDGVDVEHAPRPDVGEGVGEELAAPRSARARAGRTRRGGGRGSRRTRPRPGPRVRSPRDSPRGSRTRPG